MYSLNRSKPTTVINPPTPAPSLELDFDSDELNTCLCCVCYEIMAPSEKIKAASSSKDTKSLKNSSRSSSSGSTSSLDHSPVIVVPCGHSICTVCLERDKTRKCPLCRSNIQSHAVNFALQQIIISLLDKKSKAFSEALIQKSHQQACELKVTHIWTS
jgi:hypothetical protein